MSEPKNEEDYKLVKVFDAKKRLLSYRYVPGEDYVKFDSTFAVFQRREKASSRTPSS